LPTGKGHPRRPSSVALFWSPRFALARAVAVGEARAAPWERWMRVWPRMASGPPAEPAARPVPRAVRAEDRLVVALAPPPRGEREGQVADQVEPTEMVEAKEATPRPGVAAPDWLGAVAGQERPALREAAAPPAPG